MRLANTLPFLPFIATLAVAATSPKLPRLNHRTESGSSDEISCLDASNLDKFRDLWAACDGPTTDADWDELDSDEYAETTACFCEPDHLAGLHEALYLYPQKCLPEDFDEEEVADLWFYDECPGGEDLLAAARAEVSRAGAFFYFQTPPPSSNSAQLLIWEFGLGAAC